MPRNPHGDSASKRSQALWDNLFATLTAIVHERTQRQSAHTPRLSMPEVFEWRTPSLQSVPIYRVLISPERFAYLNQLVTPTASTEEPSQPVKPAKSALIELYKVGDSYFVRDGNARANLARTRGQLFVAAQVTECVIAEQRADAAMVRHLLLEHERAELMQATHLDCTRPDPQLDSQTLGNLPLLQRHIGAWMHERGIAPNDDGAALWYDTVYMPVIGLLRRQQVLHALPQHSELDVYLWAFERHHSDCGADAVSFRTRLPSALSDILTLGRVLR